MPYKVWVRSKLMDGQVSVALDGTVVSAPLIWRRFIGYKFRVFVKWLERVSREKVDVKIL